MFDGKVEDKSFVDKVLNKMNKEQLDLISLALSEGLDVNYLLNADFNLEQMNVVIDGLRAEKKYYLLSGAIVRHYSSVYENKFDENQMRKILDSLIEFEEKGKASKDSLNIQRMRISQAISNLQRGTYHF